MLKQILKQLFTERSHNGWLLLELFGVSCFLLLMTDYLWIRLKNYSEPLGYDIENTWSMHLKSLQPPATAYTLPDDIRQTMGEQLQTLADRIALHPDVETVSLSMFSAPYPRGGYWGDLRRDTTELASSVNLQGHFVMPAYFEVMRIRTYDGQTIRAATDGYRSIVVTEDVAETLFGSASEAIGKEVYRDNNTSVRIVAVCTRHKNQEFEPYRPAFFEIMSVPSMEDMIKQHGNVDLLVRVRTGSDAHFAAHFMDEMGERLRVNNLYVASPVSSATLRDQVVGASLRGEIRMMTYVMLFVLFTVFLGILGTFWLRVHYRRGEIGVRMAMGASKAVIRRCILVEGLCLAATAMLPAFVVYFNMLYAEVLDVWRLPFSASRVVIALSASFIILAVFIITGSVLPANRAANITPVEALGSEE